MTDTTTIPTLTTTTQPGTGHILVVWLDEYGERQYDVECAGVDDACVAWLECAVEGCPPFLRQSPDEDRAIDGGGFVNHGQEHRRLEGMDWSTRTGQCFIAEHDRLNEAAGELDLIPGRYPVQMGYLPYADAEDLTLELVSDAAGAVTR